jgi:hypothetical protein
MNADKIEKLENLKSKIESLSKHHQLQILSVLSKNSCKINENKSGCYINISFLPDETIEKMAEYLNYIEDQEESLETVEYQKAEFKNAFFNEKEDKDNVTISYNSK